MMNISALDVKVTQVEYALYKLPAITGQLRCLEILTVIIFCDSKLIS